MLGLKLIHVRKRGNWSHSIARLRMPNIIFKRVPSGGWGWWGVGGVGGGGGGGGGGRGGG